MEMTLSKREKMSVFFSASVSRGGSWNGEKRRARLQEV